MIELLTGFVSQYVPSVLGVLWIGWWAQRRVAQCEERCTRALEKMIALLPPCVPPADTPGITYEEPPVLVLEQPPTPLPVARALKT